MIDLEVFYKYQYGLDQGLGKGQDDNTIVEDCEAMQNKPKENGM